MKRSSSRVSRRRLGVALALACLGVGAAPAEPGAALPLFKLNDQHDKAVLIGPATQILIFTAEKPASDMVIKVLSAKPKGALERSGTVYVADISALPTVFARMFALPKLRELPFPVALARDAATVADLPRRAGFATVLTLRSEQVIRVQYAQDEAQLLRAIEAAP